MDKSPLLNRVNNMNRSLKPGTHGDREINIFIDGFQYSHNLRYEALF